MELAIDETVNKTNCKYTSSIRYNELLESNKKEVLLPKDIVKKLYNYIVTAGQDEYLENKLMGIDFEYNITLDDFRDINDTSKEISKKIADLIGNNDGYYYIYFNVYQSKKKDFGETLRISINTTKNHVFIHLKHGILHQRPEQKHITEEIKSKIKENLNLTSSDIY
ncbi:3752_t:CDS:2, partial [Dentiscutata erythropus]